MSGKHTILTAIAAFSLAIGAARAADSSPFPYSPSETGFDDSYVGVTYADLNRFDVARSGAEPPFPWVPDENAADQPYTPGGSYAEQHRGGVALASGSAFPWTPEENGGVYLDSATNDGSALANAAGKEVRGSL